MGTYRVETIAMALRERFWEKVEKGDEDECWEWTASIDGNGYGQISDGDRLRQAHRVSMDLDGRDIDGQLVLHHCDNRTCVNPHHLYLGDYTDNLDDARNRGRWDGREDSKLSLSDIKEIRESDDSPGELAEEFDVSKSHIYNVRSGRRGPPLEE